MVPTAIEIETGTGIPPIEVTTIIAKILIILANLLIKEGFQTLIPRIIRMRLILKVLTNQHSPILIRIIPKISDSLETLLAIEQVVSFVAQSAVTHGFTNRIEIVSLLRQEETKILPNLREIMLNVLVAILKLDAQAVSTFPVEI